jgi:hypothetical protein
MKRAYAIATLSVLGGVAVHLMVMLVLRVEGPSVRDPFPAQAPIHYVGGLGSGADPALIQRAALSDSAPLFMPTKWNLVSQMDEVASLNEATEIFEPFSAILNLARSSPVQPVGTLPSGNVDRLRLPDSPAFFLSRFGQRERDSFIPEIAGPAFRASRVGMQAPLDPGNTPLPGGLVQQAPPGLWNPVQFFLQMENGVPLGLPMIAQSSGSVDWDQSLQGHFTSLAFYRELKDGYYQIWVYP